MIGTRREPLYRLHDLPPNSQSEGPGLEGSGGEYARFPHLNSEQYLSACEDANFIPPFLIGTCFPLVVP